VPEPGPPNGAFREELNRLLRSETFRASESLRKLLGYLGQAYEAGTSRQLKEYSIGRDVMLKPEDYDPRVDASVRVQVGKLRQRLDQYYHEEGAASLHRITLPKGRFELAFDSPPPPPPPQPKPASRLIPILALALLASLVWGAFGWWRALAPEVAAGAPMPEEVRQFWAPFVESRQRLVFVLGSPLFVRFHNQYYRHPMANTWPEVEKTVPLEALRRLLQAPTEPAETRRWTPLGEAMAAHRLAMVLGPVRPDASLKRSTALAWEDIKSTNLVFLGPPKFNPQTQALPIRQEFVFTGDVITNLRPQPGELAEYRTVRDPEIEDIPAEYALMTRLRGLEGWGEVLILASTTTEGTWAAAEYVTSPTTLRQLFARIAVNGVLPDCFQVILDCRFKQQVPIRTEYVTHRVLENVPAATP
jgi:hypothetical protein